MEDGVVIGEDDNEREESNEESGDGEVGGNGSNEEDFRPHEEYNSNDEDSDVIQMAEDLDTDLDKLDRAREVEKQKRREAEKARRARAARYSVGFIDEETDEFNVKLEFPGPSLQNSFPFPIEKS